jgi:hypothetical protein
MSLVSDTVLLDYRDLTDSVRLPVSRRAVLPRSMEVIKRLNRESSG